MKKQQPKEEFVRWYKVDPQVRDMAARLKALSPQWQHFMGQVMYSLVKEEGASLAQNSQKLHGLHPERLNGILNAHKKRRWYDQDEYLHKVFNLMYLQSEEKRRQCASFFLPALIVLQEFVDRFQAQGTTEEYDLAFAIVKTALFKGLNEAKEQLRAAAHSTRSEPPEPVVM